MLLAGERPGEQAFPASQGVSAKALIPVAGEPMVGRVAHTLLRSPSIADIVILAQAPDRLLTGSLDWMSREARIRTFVGGQGISRSIADVAGSQEAQFPILLVTADHALLTPAMVETFLAGTDHVDVACAVVERRLLEATYPQSKRTWLRLSDGDYSGANLFALRTPESRRALQIWSRVEQNRKKALRLLIHFGPVLALRALTRTISLDRALEIAGRRAGISVRAVRMPFAEAAIDVDKPADLELAEQILAARGQQ